MTSYYSLILKEDILSISSAEDLPSAVAVCEMNSALKNLNLTGGRLLKIKGNVPLAVSFTLTHAVANLYGAVAVYDSELDRYIVSICHGPGFKIGDIIKE